MYKNFTRKILIVISILAVIAFNIFANLIPFNGQTTAEVSDKFASLFVPAGYTFSIWGLIYLLLIDFGVFQFIADKKYESLLEKITPWFIFSCAMNCFWLVFWHYEAFSLTVIFMLMLLGSLAKIYLSIRAEVREYDIKTFLLLIAPFSVYLGWICVATIANISDYLWYLGWSGEPLQPQIWVVIMMVVAGFLAIGFLLKYKDYLFAGVIVWALVGIYNNFIHIDEIVWGSFGVVAVIALISIGMLVKRIIRERTVSKV